MVNKENNFEFYICVFVKSLSRTLTSPIKYHINTAIVVRDESGIIFLSLTDSQVPEILSQLQKVTQLDVNWCEN